jgi:hypothetical protein
VIIQRRTYRALNTIGTLSLDGVTLGNTLEDVGRPEGVKIPAETCIPEGLYKAKITKSARFGRPMILLYTDDETLHCTLGEVIFTGIRCHGGTKTSQTEGCVLFDGDLAMLENAIAAHIAKGNPYVWWRITR